MSIYINIFTFQKQIDAIKALQKLEQLQDEKLLAKFVLAKDPANKSFVIEESKDGFKYINYLDQTSEAETIQVKLSLIDAIKSFGLGYQDQYIESIEMGLPAGQAVLVVFAYADWVPLSFKELANLECKIIQAPLNPDVFPPEKIASIIAADFRE